MKESMRLWHSAMAALLQESLKHALATYRHLDWQGDTIDDHHRTPTSVVVFTQQGDLEIAIRFDHPADNPYFGYTLGEAKYNHGQMDFDAALTLANVVTQIYEKHVK